MKIRCINCNSKDVVYLGSEALYEEFFRRWIPNYYYLCLKCHNIFFEDFKKTAKYNFDGNSLIKEVSKYFNG